MNFLDHQRILLEVFYSIFLLQVLKYYKCGFACLTLPDCQLKYCLQFAVARPNIFGDVKDLRGEIGQTLLSEQTRPANARVLLAAGVDWRIRDAHGQNAIERLATSSNAPNSVVTMLLLMDLTAVEFVEYCTPLVWCGASVSLELIEKMRRLVPRDRWKPCLAARLYAQLRDRHPVDFYLKDDELSQMQLEALIEPCPDLPQLEEARWRYGREPTLHLLYLADPVRVRDEILPSMIAKLGHETATRWISTLNDKGDDYTAFSSQTDIRLEVPEVPNPH